MEYLPADRVHFRLDPNIEPTVIIEPGTEILVDTLDNEAGRIRSESDRDASPLDQVNPVTGPIGILTVEPGNVVRIEILEIRVAPYGHIQLISGYGVLADRVKSPKTKIVAIKDDLIHFNKQTKLPIRPMVGTIGVIPRESVISLFAGAYGGNMDNKNIAPGSVLYVKAQVPLGLIYLGDLHALMGDGEVCLNGIEVAGSVHLRIGIEKGLSVRYPMVETSDTWEVVVANWDLDKAIEIACGEIAEFLAHRLDISLEEAAMLTGIACDVQICQAAPRRACGAVVRAVVNKQLLQADR